MNGRTKTSFEFGDYLLVPDEQLLLKNGVPVQLPPKAFDILVVLVENAGELVDKQQLLDLVWKDSFVEEANIQVYISAIRKILSDSGNGKYIETVPKRGYRFNSAVTVKENGSLLAGPIVAGGKGSSWTSLAPQAEDSNKRVTSKRRYISIILAVALVLLSVVGFSIYSITFRQNSITNTLAITRITNSGRIQRTALSPDGKYVAYVLSLPDGKKSLVLKNLSTDDDRDLIAPAVVDVWGRISFSPDSAFIYYSAARAVNQSQLSLYRISIHGGEPVRLLDDVFDTVSFSPDGDRFAFVRGTKAPKRALQTASLRDVLVGKIEIETIAVFEYPESPFWFVPAWSPDGSTIVCSVGSFAEPRSFQLIGFSPDGQSRRLMSKQKWGWINSVVWMNNSRELLVTGNQTQLYQQTHLWRIDAEGNAGQLTKDFNGFMNLGLTTDQAVLAAQRFVHETNIFVNDTPITDRGFFSADNFRRITRDIETGHGIGGVKWAANGNLLSSDRRQLFAYSSDFSTAYPLLAKDDLYPNRPVIAPDSKRVFFAGENGNEPGLFRLNREDGSVQLLARNTVQLSGPAITPDGHFVIYTCLQKDGNTGLCRIPAGGGDSIELTTGYTAEYPVISPNGEFVIFRYYPNDEKTKLAVGLISLSDPGAEPRSFLAFGGTSDVGGTNEWLPDSSAFLTNYQEKGVMNVRAIPINGDEPYNLTNFSDDQKIFSFSLSPDGKRLAVSRGIRKDDVVLIRNFAALTGP